MKRKYGNKKVSINGRVFDSKREAERFLVLADAERRGIISNLECQPTWELVPHQYATEIVQLKTKTKEVQRLVERKIEYTADFRYVKNGEVVVEDVKISKYMLPKEFVLKRKLMLWRHGVRIREVYKAGEPV